MSGGWLSQAKKRLSFFAPMPRGGSALTAWGPQAPKIE